MGVLEPVALVSVPQQQSRRLFLFYVRQNERAVLYSRQPGEAQAEAGGRPGHSWTRKAPPGQGLLPHHPALCTTLLLLHASSPATVQRCSSPRAGTALLP